MIVVDDALLLAVITSHPDVEVLEAAANDGQLFTTGSWYWRLARAIGHPGRGSLSRQLDSMREEERRRVRSALSQLPAEVGLLSLRSPVPVMSALGGQLNLLTAEAVAAAIVLGAEIAVTTESPLLESAAEVAGVTVRHFGLRAI